MFQKMFKTLSALPVSGITAKVVADIMGGTVTVVASATGSGKTLLLPASLQQALAQHGFRLGENTVVVLVPRRFLAVNAAETVAELSELELGDEVGYAVGAQSGEDSRRSANTKVLYCTYGYAIASGLINTARFVVLDEIHEASLDMSICRAVVHRRLAAGERVHVLEMSATINAERQAAYWRPVAPVSVVEIDGRTFPCERRHRPAQKPQDAVLELIAEGRAGILVFRPGRGEVEETAEAIRQLVGDDVEVSEIYGELDYMSRKAAVEAPKGRVKVLVSTNVTESGANIPWLDAGVTCGTAKELSVRPETGATYLALIHLPRWRLDQQEGRVKRFRPGVFVLCSPLAYGERPAETNPEIKRLSLTELVMHCASFGLRTNELVFDYAPERIRLVEAETKLQRLGLIDNNCRLTKAGQFVSGMPLGPETGAMLWHAKEIGVLDAALMLAAVIEVDGVRKDFRYPHRLDSNSDWLDAYKAFQIVYAERDAAARKDLMERYNVGFKRYKAAKEMYRDLARRYGEGSAAAEEVTDAQLVQCLVAGFVTNLFRVNERVMVPVISPFSVSYNQGNGSSVYLFSGCALGQLRTIQPKDKTKSSFTIVEKVTIVSLEDIMAIVKIRPALVTIERHRVQVASFEYEEVTERKLFGVYALPTERRESPLTEAEQALKAERNQFRVRLQRLNEPREALGMASLRFHDDYFRVGYAGREYSYTEADVCDAERASADDVARMHALMERAEERARPTVAEPVAPRPAHVSPVHGETKVAAGASALAALASHFNRR